jgi:hypothetical protein
MRHLPLAAISAFSVALLALAQEPAPALPPDYVGPPTSEHAVTNRAFQGIPSLAVAPGGRLWATWYAGVTPAEDHNNYVVLSTSGDNGKTWTEVLVADPDGSGPRRTFDPELWLAPDGTVRWIWADRVGGDPKTDGLWMIDLSDPASERTAWKPPVCVARGVMMCKPLVLSSGEWALPLCTWFTDHSSKMVVSTDKGKTWTLRGGADIPKEARTFDEHMFVERKDKSLWVLSRTKYGIGESVSSDRGATWPELTPSSIAHPSARFFITRLTSGNLLLVKHGPITEKTGRSHLTAFISADDGKTWSGGLLLDERSGVSYPDGQQTADGLIRVIYDYSRTGDRHILMATFKEEDAAAGKPVTDAVRLRQLVSEATGGLEKTISPVSANSDGVPLVKIPAGTLVSDGAVAAPLAKDAKLFTDRAYTCAEVPDALKGAHFLQVPLNGKKTIRCARAGMAYVLTPAPARNKDSVSKDLLGQGFTKVLQPEVRLFDPGNSHNLSTLYQKVCAEGEQITLGKWGVPLFFP